MAESPEPRRRRGVRARTGSRAACGLQEFRGDVRGRAYGRHRVDDRAVVRGRRCERFDLIVGLILGNVLAVLSWVFLTAPIATRARLTLYYQLELICGRNLVTLYNLVNGVMFCFLAGAMVTVSATAVGVWIDFPMPRLNDLYPNSLGWVLALLGVGAIISIVAAYGYEIVARVANIAAPWMVLVFVAFGLVGVRQLGHRLARATVGAGHD